jgi:hypothetical protein
VAPPYRRRGDGEEVILWGGSGYRVTAPALGGKPNLGLGGGGTYQNRGVRHSRRGIGLRTRQRRRPSSEAVADDGDSTRKRGGLNRDMVREVGNLTHTKKNTRSYGCF